MLNTSWSTVTGFMDVCHVVADQRVTSPRIIPHFMTGATLLLRIHAVYCIMASFSGASFKFRCIILSREVRRKGYFHDHVLLLPTSFKK